MMSTHLCYHLQAFQAGIVWINCSQPCFCQAPWGGTKRSGFGRELGEWYGFNFPCPNLQIMFLVIYFISTSQTRLHIHYIYLKKEVKNTPVTHEKLYFFQFLSSGDLIITWAWSKLPNISLMNHGVGTRLHRSCKSFYSNEIRKINNVLGWIK